MSLSEETIAGLSPGIRDLVIHLDSLGFQTTDSGDGSNHIAGMEGALPVPMVAIRTTPQAFFCNARLLFRELQLYEPGSWDVQATYSPSDRTCILLATKHPFQR